MARRRKPWKCSIPAFPDSCVCNSAPPRFPARRRLPGNYAAPYRPAHPQTGNHRGIQRRTRRYPEKTDSQEKRGNRKNGIRAAPINPSSTLDVSSHVIPTLTPIPPDRPWCVMFPSLCPYVLIVQLPLISENMTYLVFCSCVSLLRMMVSSFFYIPAKDIISSSFMAV